MSKPRELLVAIESNRRTCGDCAYLRKIPDPRSSDEWWCDLFVESRGWVGAQKTPNRSNTCLNAEKALER